MNWKARVKRIFDMVVAVVLLGVLVAMLALSFYQIWNTYAHLTVGVIFKITFWESFLLMGSFLLIVAMAKWMLKLIDFIVPNKVLVSVDGLEDMLETEVEYVDDNAPDTGKPIFAR